MGLVLAGMLLAGCGSGTTAVTAASSRSPAPSPASSSAGVSGTVSGAPSSSAPAAPGPLSRRCDEPTVSSRSLPFRASDGVALDGVETGTGRRGVVLVNELGRRQLCGWAEYAGRLAASGFRVLLFDQRCNGASACPVNDSGGYLARDVAGAAARLQADGASSVQLIGASQGGGVVVAAGGMRLARVRSVVALSPAILTENFGAGTAQALAAKINVPLLVAVGPLDPDSPLPDVRQLAAAVPPALVRFELQSPDAGHGWDMLRDTQTGAPNALAATVLSFLRAHGR